MYAKIIFERIAGMGTSLSQKSFDTEAEMNRWIKRNVDCAEPKCEIIEMRVYTDGV